MRRLKDRTRVDLSSNLIKPQDCVKQAGHIKTTWGSGAHKNLGQKTLPFQNPISTAMKVNLRKRRLESSSEEEDEAVKEIKRLTNKVKGLEAILASKSKESTKKEREQLKEERKQVEEGKNKLEKIKTKVEEDTGVLQKTLYIILH